jgi:hypothetical protein
MTRTHPANLLTPRTVSETVFGWLRRLEAPGVAGQVAGWQEEQWHTARTALQVHGIAPLLYKTLHESPAWDALSPPIQSYLAAQYRLNGQRVATLAAELRAILEAAGLAGIALLPLKGAVLITHYYQDQALRPLADLDFLVNAGDELRVAALLRKLAYRPILSPERHQRYILARGTLQVASTVGEHPDNPYLVEVHTEVKEDFQGSSYTITEDLWSGNAPGLFGVTPGLCLKPWVLFQHLLIHAARDIMGQRARLIQLYDLALVAACLDRPSWERLARAGGRRREERWLYAPLRFMQRYLGTPVPPDIMAFLAQGTPAGLRRFLEQTDLYTLSLCNPFSKSLLEALSWHRPDRELLAALRHLILPPPQDPRVASLEGHPLRAYLTLAWRRVLWTACSLLRLSLDYRKRQ